MKKKLFLTVLLASLFLAVSCSSSKTVTEETKTETRFSEKGVSTIAAEDAPVMPEILMEDTGALSLYKKYEDKGIRIGTCLLPSDLEDSWVEEKILSQFSSINLFEGLKSAQLADREQSISTGELCVRFDEKTKSIMNWAKENGKQVHAHTLIWFKSNPEWMFRENFSDDGPYVSRDEMLKRMESYIRGVFGEIEKLGWEDTIYAFDIVNEYISTDGTALNDGPWTQIIGEDAIRYAFSYARKYAPKSIKLVYNESFCEISEVKRDAALALAKTLVDEDGNSLIDGLGLQGRLNPRYSMDKILSNIEYIANSIGDLELMITEIECTISVKPQVLQANLKKQGTMMYLLMNKVLELNDKGYKVTTVQFSGFRDDLNPLSAVSSASTLYDVKGNEKYAYFGILQNRELSGFED